MAVAAGYAAGAVAFWLAAYVVLRYRRTYARWAVRQQYTVAKLMLFRSPHTVWFSPRLWQVVVIGFGGYFAALGTGLWIAAAIRLVGVVGGPSPVRSAALAPLRAPVLAEMASSVVPLMVGILFCALGVLTILRRREVARFTQWQLFSNAPLEAAYPRQGEVPAAPPTKAMTTAATLAGVVMVVVGLYCVCAGLHLLLAAGGP